MRSLCSPELSTANSHAAMMLAPIAASAPLYSALMQNGGSLNECRGHEPTRVERLAGFIARAA
jgi:hypothetical protein